MGKSGESRGRKAKGPGPKGWQPAAETIVSKRRLKSRFLF
jgi:hypothetical protein